MTPANTSHLSRLQLAAVAAALAGSIVAASAVTATNVAFATRHGHSSAHAAPPANSASRASQPRRDELELSIDNFAFTPKSLTVPAGTTVTWVNHDDVPHTATATNQQFASSPLDTDDRFTFQFTEPGTYTYFCLLHPKMTGEIVVQ